MYQCLSIVRPHVLGGCIVGVWLVFYLAIPPLIHTFWQHLAVVALASLSPMMCLPLLIGAIGRPHSIFDERLSQRLQRASERIGDGVRVPVFVSFRGLYEVKIIGMSRRHCQVFIPYYLLEALDQTELDLLLLHIAAHLRHLSPVLWLRLYIWWTLGYWLTVIWMDTLVWFIGRVHFGVHTLLSIVVAAYGASAWFYGDRARELIRQHETVADEVASVMGGDVGRYVRMLERLGNMNAIGRFAEERAERVWRLKREL